jgi:hypothetical protein
MQNQYETLEELIGAEVEIGGDAGHCVWME